MGDPVEGSRIIVSVKCIVFGTWNDRKSTNLFQADIFQEFTIREDLVGFQVNLTVLLDCLNIFGGSTVAGKDGTYL